MESFTSTMDLKTWLGGVFALGPPSVATRQVVKRLSRRVPDILQLLLDDRAAMNDCIECSYQHRNGFDKIVLFSSDAPAYKLRLHVWWPTTGDGGEDIHNHRWDFSTAILAGGYVFQQFAPFHGGASFQHYRYSRGIAENAFSMQYIDDAPLLAIFDCRVSAGDSYFLHRDILHRVVKDPDTLTITLMCQGPACRDDTDVYTQDHNVRGGDVSGEQLSAPRMRQCLEYCRDALSTPYPDRRGAAR
jgi:hypothetical protein